MNLASSQRSVVVRVRRLVVLMLSAVLAYGVLTPVSAGARQDGPRPEDKFEQVALTGDHPSRWIVHIGQARVRVIAEDAEGNTSSRTWSFTVLN